MASCHWLPGNSWKDRYAAKPHATGHRQRGVLVLLRRLAEQADFARAAHQHHVEHPVIEADLKQLRHKDLPPLNGDAPFMGSNTPSIAFRSVVVPRPLEASSVKAATAIIAAIGDGAEFKNGRHLAAWICLVPRQFSSGDRTDDIDGYLQARQPTPTQPAGSWRAGCCPNSAV